MFALEWQYMLTGEWIGYTDQIATMEEAEELKVEVCKSYTTGQKVKHFNPDFVRIVEA